jgi:hypothetical protein
VTRAFTLLPCSIDMCAPLTQVEVRWLVWYSIRSITNARRKPRRLNGLLAATLMTAPLSAADRLAAWMSRFNALREIAHQRVPFRSLRDEAHRFTAELEREAAKEREPVPNVDAGSGDGVPYLFAVDGFGNGSSGGRCV